MKRKFETHDDVQSFEDALDYLTSRTKQEVTNTDYFLCNIMSGYQRNTDLRCRYLTIFFCPTESEIDEYEMHPGTPWLSTSRSAITPSAFIDEDTDTMRIRDNHIRLMIMQLAVLLWHDDEADKNLKYVMNEDNYHKYTREL